MIYLSKFLSECSYALLFLITPLYLSEIGAPSSTIGAIVSLHGVFFFLGSYLAGRLSDIFRIRKNITIVLLILSSAFLFCQGLARNIISFTILRMIFAFFAGGFFSIFTAYGYELGVRYGTFLSIGSLGWAIGSFLFGFIKDLTKCFFASAILLFSALFFFLPVRDVQPQIKASGLFPRIPRNFLNLFFAFFIRHLGATAVWVIFAIYLRSKGANDFWISFITGINPLFQFIIMNFIDRVDSDLSVKLGFIFSFCGFLLWSILTHYKFLFFAQILIAFSWSFLFVGITRYIFERTDERATYSGITFSTISLSSIAGPLIGGAIYGIFPLSPMIFATICCLISILLSRKL